ncbi:MAG: anthranilate synthase component I family protein, partial [Gammaproteobacteria bacterium]|nr:anthranilate synthase component I family protein [Gammaproteobacteria bacterium]
RRAYGRAFERVQEYIRAGDCYQVNLARHYRAGFRGDHRDAAWQIYSHLCEVNPAPYCAYLETADGAIASLSPERFLRVEGATVTSMPIKGTRPRGGTDAEDAQQRAALLASEKDRAENLMIVDLVRHDLGRVCRPGSIQTPRLFDIESFAAVHHLVSTVTGERRADVTPLGVPGGGISRRVHHGAPKHAAMKIIDALEPVGRSIYCGAIGYVDGSGLLDSNVAIRTLVIGRDAIHCWGGGGIVADSRADKESREIDQKISQLLQGVVAVASNASRAR